MRFSSTLQPSCLLIVLFYSVFILIGSLHFSYALIGSLHRLRAIHCYVCSVRLICVSSIVLIGLFVFGLNYNIIKWITKEIIFSLTLASVVDVEQSSLAFTGVVTGSVYTNAELPRTAKQVWIQTFIDVFKNKMKWLSMTSSTFYQFFYFLGIPTLITAGWEFDEILRKKWWRCTFNHNTKCKESHHDIFAIRFVQC